LGGYEDDGIAGDVDCETAADEWVGGIYDGE